MPTFGEKLRKLRKRRGWTQQELTERLGYMSQATIALLELGKRQPTSEVIIKVADLFGVTTDVLLRDHLNLPPDDPAAPAE